jgi:ATP-binding protein involved in chromosome partitioning
LFGEGGGKMLADELGVPLLAQIPLVNQLREGGDDGKPIAAIAPQSEVGQIFAELAKKIVEMRPKKVFSQALKVN